MKGLNQKATGLAQFLDSRGYSGAGDTVMKMAGTINRLETENADLRAQLDVKSIEIVGLHAQLEAERKHAAAAAAVPKEFEQAIDNLIQALTLGGYSELTNAASYVWQMWDAWRGGQDGEKE